ncbi:protein kinase [Streptomyces sp. NPDC056387]|uniref:protein kinase domain-containing protein n=1 Tax=Streptomyces sp. NPDC056387 TaxID=3345803 RepID=UPI0035E148FF
MWGRGTVLGDRYTLAERIGGGGMGEVWRADDDVLRRQVAVKVLLPTLLDDLSFAARFRREATVLASLSHPGIVDVHDYGESRIDSGEQVAYIVMELVEGRTLTEVRAQNGPLPVEQALDIAGQALDALHAAHLQGVTHRDIKPSNLMLGEHGRVTVTDFGIARSSAASTGITDSHAVLGTALYMAPEQAEGLGAVAGSDLYSMGVVCYELLTGEPPFTGESVVEIALKHIREPVPHLPAEFPEPVRAFVARALAKRPEERYADASVMAAAARRAAAGRPLGELDAPAGPVLAPTGPDPAAGAELRRTWRDRLRIPAQISAPLAIGVTVTITVSVAVTVFAIDPGARRTDAGGPVRPSASVSAPASGSAVQSPGPAPSASAGAGRPVPGPSSPAGIRPHRAAGPRATAGLSPVRVRAAARAVRPSPEVRARPRAARATAVRATRARATAVRATTDPPRRRAVAEPAGAPSPTSATGSGSAWAARPRRAAPRWSWAAPRRSGGCTRRAATTASGPAVPPVSRCRGR